MNDSIRLSKKHGVNPSLLRCFVCGKEFGIAMLGELPNDEEAPKAIIDGEMCDNCKKKIKDGYVAMVEASNIHPDTKTINMKDVKLAGRSVFVRKEMFGDRIDTSKGVMFCDKEIMDNLLSKAKKSDDSEIKKDE